MAKQLASGPSYGLPSPGRPRSGSSFFSFHTERRWAPPVNLYETELGYTVCVDLAGVNKERIDVEVTGRQLKLSGHRPVPSDFGQPTPTETGDPARIGTPARKCRVHVMEIDHGVFERYVELPSDACSDGITARYREGFLWIDIPRQGPTPAVNPKARKEVKA